MYLDSWYALTGQRNEDEIEKLDENIINVVVPKWPLFEELTKKDGWLHWVIGDTLGHKNVGIIEQAYYCGKVNWEFLLWLYVKYVYSIDEMTDMIWSLCSNGYKMVGQELIR